MQCYKIGSQLERRKQKPDYYQWKSCAFFLLCAENWKYIEKLLKSLNSQIVKWKKKENIQQIKSIHIRIIHIYRAFNIEEDWTSYIHQSQPVIVIKISLLLPPSTCVSWMFERKRNQSVWTLIEVWTKRKRSNKQE